jgi:hypothetical protein
LDDHVGSTLRDKLAPLTPLPEAVSELIQYRRRDMAAEDLNSAIERSHAAVAAIFRGNPEPAKTLFSDEADIILGNPFGPFVRGRENVVEAYTTAAANYRDGEVTGVDLVAKYVCNSLACVIEVEHGRAKVGGGDRMVTLALRVTSLFRLEHGTGNLSTGMRTQLRCLAPAHP